MMTVNFTTLTLLAATIFGVRWAIDDLRPDPRVYSAPSNDPSYAEFGFSAIDQDQDYASASKDNRRRAPATPFALLDGIAHHPK